MPEFRAVVFAGGVGERLWPLSRRNTPKQFAPLIDAKSSIQLAVERLARVAAPDRIYISTNQIYADVLGRQLPLVPPANFILEPAKRDVAAAVALAFFTLEKDGARGPVIFQWADHYVSRPETLLRLFRAAGQAIEADPQRIILVAEEPKSANDNLGWIELGPEQGSVDGLPYHSFGAWHYKPALDACQQMFESGRYVWNTGHFVTSVEFMTGSFRQLAPDLARGVEAIVSYRGTPEEKQKLAELYVHLPKHHFDDAFLKVIPRHQALLFKADLGWMDPGNLNSLKEALQALESAPRATVALGGGKVIHLRTADSLVYNNTDKPVIAMGLSGVVVVEMPDVTLVIDKEAVRDMGVLLRELEAQGLSKLL